MIDSETADRKESVGSLTEHAKGISAHLADVWTHANEATDAQFSMYRLKATRWMVIFVFCGFATIALCALAGYGFWLLDGCLAYALSQPSMPVWLASLIRGSIYLGAPLATSLFIWKSTVGFGAEPGGGVPVSVTTPRTGE